MRYFKIFGVSIGYWLILSIGFSIVLGLQSDSSFATQPTPIQPAPRLAQASSYSPQNGDEEAAIAAYLAAVAAKQAAPGATTVTKLVISGDYALLDWVYSQMGGQAVLTKKDGAWRLIRGVGGAFDVPSLMRQGVPERDARDLMSAYRTLAR